MAKVVLKDNESLDEALRRFKRLVKKENILQEVKEREYYQKKKLSKRKK